MRRESFRLSGFADHERVSAALATKGLSPDAASAVATRLARASSELSASAEKGAPGIAFFVPGRIEVLGKHTDYAGGSSLVCALQRGIAIVGTPRNDRTVTVRDCDLDVQAEFEIDAGTAARQGHWSNYGISVARRIVRDFPGDHSGASLAIASTLPVASGMSSSSALTVSIFLALSAVNHLDDREDYKRLFRRPTALAEYLGAVESGRPYAGFDADAGVGTLGGNEDHTAILCSDPGLLKWFSYLPIQLRGGVALPPGYVLAVAFSGVRAEKTGRALDLYNAVSDKAAAIAEVWRSETGRSEAHLGAIASIPGYSRTEVMLALLNRPHERFSEAELIDRLYQFHYESQVILPRAVDALQRGDVEEFGKQVEHSQQLAETKLGNQVNETVMLVHDARMRGASAASAFGGGFGGAVWALVKRASAGEFLAGWSAALADRFPHRSGNACFFVDEPGPAAFQLEM